MDNEIQGIKNDKKKSKKISCNVLMVVTILSAAMLLIDWASVFNLFPSEKEQKCITTDKEINGEQHKKSDVKQKLQKKQESFLLKQYDTAIKEIHERLRQESLLFSMKFSLVGAILALMFTSAIKSSKDGGEEPGGSGIKGLKSNPIIVAMFCWAATIASAIVDTRIMYHCDIVSLLGSWIRYNVEQSIYDGTGIIGWESMLINKGVIFNLHLYPFLRFDTNILTFFLFLANSILFSSKRFLFNNKSKQFRYVCTLGSIGCFFVFFFISIHYHYHNQFLWPLICLVICVSGALCSASFWKNCSDSSEETQKVVEK